MLIDVFVYRLCHETIADYALAADACDALTLSLLLRLWLEEPGMKPG